jgi:hypothetical protein
LKAALIIIITLSILFHVNAQEIEQMKHKSLASFLANGKVNGKSRLYFMATDNAAPLSDYHGLGFGGGIGYKTPTYKGFSAGMSGFFILNAYSSDFTIPDSITQNPNRYELGLFDVTDPENKSNLYRLEDLWVQYKKDNLNLRYGQFVPNYLFINPQDGRMSPTMTRGFEGNWQKGKSAVILAYIHDISPRSTVKWYTVSETFGIYPSGRAVDGSASDYLGNIDTKGIFLAEWNQKVAAHSFIKLGSMSVLKVLQTWYTNISSSKNGWSANVMGIYQHALNSETNQSFFVSGDNSLVFSGQLAKKTRKWQANINYTRIADKGRFLMPREWGREPLYTFLPRERNEGLADTHAATVQIKNDVNKELSFNLGLGKYWLPNPAEANKNKYAMPSYNQLNVEANYAFNGWLEGTKIKALFVRKDGRTDSLENQKFVFNKVNLNILNIILNYNF